MEYEEILLNARVNLPNVLGGVVAAYTVSQWYCTCGDSIALG
jgi:hypothetical protein